jgi:hypothetical protein
VKPKAIPWDYRPLIKTYFESIHEQPGVDGGR